MHIQLHCSIRPSSIYNRLFYSSNVDPLCDSDHFREFLSIRPNNFAWMLTRGDHSLRIKNTDGQYDIELGAKNLRAISKWIFSWL